MRLCIVRTPQDDDNSLPKLLARSDAPASGRAQGSGGEEKFDLRYSAGLDVTCLCRIGTVGMARIVSVPTVVMRAIVPAAKVLFHFPPSQTQPHGSCPSVLSGTRSLPTCRAAIFPRE